MSLTHYPSHVTSDIDSLHALRFSRPRHMISVQRFLQRFGYAVPHLEELCRVKPGAALDNPFSARVQRFMAVALDVVAQHMLFSSGLNEAIEWFKTEKLPEHGGRTPEELVASGEQRLLLKVPLPRAN